MIIVLTGLHGSGKSYFANNICKKYGFDIEFDNIEKITERFKDMEKKDVVNELTSVKESVKELNKQISDYVQENIKQKNKEQER